MKLEIVDSIPENKSPARRLNGTSIRAQILKALESMNLRPGQTVRISVDAVDGKRHALMNAAYSIPFEAPYTGTCRLKDEPPAAYFTRIPGSLPAKRESEKKKRHKKWPLLKKYGIEIQEKDGATGIPAPQLRDVLEINGLWEDFSKWFKGNTVGAAGIYPQDVEMFLERLPNND